MSPLQFKLGRTALGLSVREIAKELGISPTTVMRFESGGGTHQSTAAALSAFLTERGIEPIERSDGATGILYRPPS